MNNNLLKVGVIGVGHLGQHHVKHFCSIDGINFLGLFDTNTIQANAISKKFNVKAFQNIDSLIDSVDAVSIVTPTTYHASVAEKCIKKKKHVFILQIIFKIINFTSSTNFDIFFYLISFCHFRD